MTRLRIGLVIVVVMIGSVRAGDAVAPAAKKPAADAQKAAKRDADILDWFQKSEPALQVWIDQQAKQLEQQLDPVLASELEMVRITCDDLDPAARKKILEAGRKARTKAARDMAQRQRKHVHDRDFDPRDFDPRIEVRAGLSEALQAVAKPEQFARYEQENDARAARQARAARLRIVARLDHYLDLSAGQQERIEKAIEAQWQPEWIVALADGERVADRTIAPDYAKDAIEPHLAPAQQTAWKNWCHVSGGSIDNVRYKVARGQITWNFDGQGIQGDDPWWGR